MKPKSHNHYKQIPNLLRRYRKERGLKQIDVAKVLGMRNSSVISQWENGKAIPNLVNAIKLSVLYRVMVDTLFIEHLHACREEIHKVETECIKSDSKAQLTKN